MLPIIAEIILVRKNGAFSVHDIAQREICFLQNHRVVFVLRKMVLGVGVESTVHVEPMQMAVVPPHGHLQHRVQPVQPRIGGNQKAPPDLWSDAIQRHFDLQHRDPAWHEPSFRLHPSENQAPTGPGSGRSAHSPLADGFPAEKITLRYLTKHHPECSGSAFVGLLFARKLSPGTGHFGEDQAQVAFCWGGRRPVLGLG